jgi:hypothetical protein
MRLTLHGQQALRPRRASTWRRVRLVLLPTVAVLLLYLVWPYFTLWQLDQALVSGDAAALDRLVDLAAVRDEIKRKLNKDSTSSIGDLSDPFIRWLEAGIQAAGSGAVDQLVTLDWVRDQLLADVAGKGLLPRLSFAFFDAPDGFRLTVDGSGGNPVHARLTLGNAAWRVSALYY